MDENETPKPMGQVIQIDEARIRDHFGEMVRGAVACATSPEPQWFTRKYINMTPLFADQTQEAVVV